MDDGALGRGQGSAAPPARRSVDPSSASSGLTLQYRGMTRANAYGTLFFRRPIQPKPTPAGAVTSETLVFTEGEGFLRGTATALDWPYACPISSA